MIDLALEYAKEGIRVFPLYPKSKFPATKRGVLDASSDLDRVREWWEPNPIQNIAIATGLQFDVIDLDGATGIKNFKERFPKADFRKIRSVRTPNGGFHLYCQTWPDSTNRAGMLGRGSCVDYRALGGYVVAPPSKAWTKTAPKELRAYRWHSSPGAPLLELDLSEFFDDQLIDADDLIEPREANSFTHYGRAALANAVESIMEAVSGTRNDTLNIESLAIYELVAGGEIPEVKANEYLYRAAKLCGLEEIEIRRTMESAKRKGFSQPRRVGTSGQ